MGLAMTTNLTLGGRKTEGEQRTGKGEGMKEEPNNSLSEEGKKNS